nr:GNAT family N-acetyltransferase [Bacteroidales bacterium]
IDDIETFYHMLSELYTHKVKKPLPTFEFFEQLYKSTFAKCLLVVKKDVIIGGVMCPIFRDDMLYEWYICGQDKLFPDAHPSIMAMWSMVEYAHQNGIHAIDLMGAGQEGIPSSVRDFKSRFGGELVENGRLVYKFKPFLYALGSLYLKFKAKL